MGSYNVKNDIFSQISEDFAVSVFRDCDFSSGGCWSNCKGSGTVAWIHVRLSKIPVTSSGSDVQNLCSHSMWTKYKHFLTSVTSISTWTKLGRQESDDSNFLRNVGETFILLGGLTTKSPSLAKRLSEKLINNIHIVFFLTFCWPCISVYLSQYLTNLMHKICFTIRFISFPYLFRAHVLIIRRSKLHYTLQFWPPDNEHMCSKQVEEWNKTYCETNFVHQVG